MRQRVVYLGLLLLLLLLVSSCTHRTSDETIARDIQSKLAADPVTGDSQVAVEVTEGKVTLRGTAKTEEARQRLEIIARNEAGVTSVEDLTSVVVTKTEKVEPAAPPPPQPVVIPAGTVLTIRTNQAIASDKSQAGSAFTGTVLTPVSLEGKLVIPAGSGVVGTVVKAKKAGRFKGGALLALIVHSVTVSGHTFTIATELVERQSTGKGKRTAAMVGGGTGVGAVIGGIAAGGKGAAIGAVAGATGGTIGAMTGKRNITLPAESALNFRLLQPLTIETEIVAK